MTVAELCGWFVDLNVWQAVGLVIGVWFVGILILILFSD